MFGRGTPPFSTRSSPDTIALIPVAAEEDRGMHVLIVGSGGREHALAWKIRKVPVPTVFSWPPATPAPISTAKTSTSSRPISRP